MNEVIEILRDTEAKLTELVGARVTVSMAVHENMSMSYEWTKPDMRPAKLLTFTCYEYNLTLEEITGPTRTSYLVDARCSFAHLASKLLDKRPDEIAKLLKRDRTSTINLIKRAEKFISINDPIKGKIETIENKFLNSK